MCGFCVDDQIVIVPLSGLEVRDHAARLHRVRHEPLIDHALLDDHFGLRERAIDGSVVNGLAVRLTPVPLGTSATARLFAKPS